MRTVVVGGSRTAGGGGGKAHEIRGGGGSRCLDELLVPGLPSLASEASSQGASSMKVFAEGNGGTDAGGGGGLLELGCSTAVSSSLPFGYIASKVCRAVGLSATSTVFADGPRLAGGGGEGGGSVNVLDLAELPLEVPLLGALPPS
mmetsp:Transcript_86765/g.156288  ORF Transcript_86765/g.156288 Transcript_86765/m.156288 type:complete len:146 (+) Transcript_86765:30-467(+)